MTNEQREKLREVLIDYLQVLTSTAGICKPQHEVANNARIAEVRILLKEVA